MRFLLSRRWLTFFVVVALAAWAAYALGVWQFNRLHEKRAENHLIQHNLAAPPLPASSLLHVGRGVSPKLEWRRVTVRGHWDDRHTVVVKYQTSDNGAPGVDVATPLVTSDGVGVVVDRGWMPSENSGDVRPHTPAPRSGEVTVTGWVRVDATGDATIVAGRQTRAIDTHTIAKTVPYKLYGNFLDLAAQSPPPNHPLAAVDMPDDTGDGPHFFYGLQWWFFGVLAVFGFFYLMYDELQRRRRGEMS